MTGISRGYAIVSLLVGLLTLFLFGPPGVDAVLDLYAFPAAPTETTLAQLARVRDVPHGTWVRLSGDFELEAAPVQPDARSGSHYLLLRDHEARLVVVYKGRRDRALTERVWTGVPTVHRTRSSDGSYRRLPRDLVFEGVDWADWKEPSVVILSTYAGPQDSRLGVVLCPLFTVLGALLVWVAASNLRPKPQTLDAAWGDDALPETACVSGFSGPKAQEYAGLLFCLGVFWVFGFGYLDFSDGRLDLRVAVGMGFGAVLLLWLGALWLRARRASAHEHLAGLIWLPVRRSYPIRSDGIASEVRVYELDLPAGAKPSRLTVHSSALHGRFVFRDASRSEVLAARLFQSNQVLVLSSSLREIREDPLAPLSHPRHRLVKLA